MTCPNLIRCLERIQEERRIHVLVATCFCCSSDGPLAALFLILFLLSRCVVEVRRVFNVVALFVALLQRTADRRGKQTAPQSSKRGKAKSRYVPVFSRLVLSSTHAFIDFAAVVVKPVWRRVDVVVGVLLH